uniref:Uncharacterized protein n=1 Tax=Desertifilum tharense IPPAS B-1220 TaxID=1781255 RepID=A0ACD5GVX0_9CYAN
MVAWGLGFYAIYKIWNQTEETPESERIQIPLGVWVWIIAILVIEITIIGSHLDFHMGLGRIIKTTINLYGRTWVLFALFPLIGCLKIRPQLVYRAISILCVQSIFFILVAFVAEAAGIPGDLYTSPLARVGGTDIFTKSSSILGVPIGCIYLHLETSALGLIGSLYFFLAWADPSKKWRFLGAVGAAAMVLGFGVATLQYLFSCCSHCQLVFIQSFSASGTRWCWCCKFRCRFIWYAPDYFLRRL